MKIDNIIRRRGCCSLCPKRNCNNYSKDAGTWMCLTCFMDRYNCSASDLKGVRQSSKRIISTSRIYAVVYERKTVIPADGRSVPAQIRNDYETTQIHQIFQEFESEEELGEWVMNAEASGLKYRALRCQEIKVTNKVQIHP